MEQKLRDHNVLASFRDMDEARHAIDALERAGIESGDISLLRPRAEDAAAEAAGRAAKVMREQEPVEIGRFDSRGNPI